MVDVPGAEEFISLKVLDTVAGGVSAQCGVAVEIVGAAKVEGAAQRSVPGHRLAGVSRAGHLVISSVVKVSYTTVGSWHPRAMLRRHANIARVSTGCTVRMFEDNI